MDIKIIPFSSLDNISKECKIKKKVLVGGCFDILHFGHLTFLQSAKEEGDMLIIALESDEFIRRRKRREPVHNQKQRAKVLSALSFVDYIILLPYFNNNIQYSSLVNKIVPAVIAVTAGDRNLKLKERQAEKIGATVKVVCPLLTSFSTSKIIDYASIFSD